MNMLLWGAQTNVSHIPIFDGLARAGFDGVEISVVGQAPEELRTLRLAVADLGLSLTTSTFVPAEANPIGANATQRVLAVDYLKARIDEAALLGSELLVGRPTRYSVAVGPPSRSGNGAGNTCVK